MTDGFVVQAPAQHSIVWHSTAQHGIASVALGKADQHCMNRASCRHDRQCKAEVDFVQGLAKCWCASLGELTREALSGVAL